MPGAKVLDSWALLCYLEKGRGHEKVIHLLEKAAEGSEPLLISVVNWGEVYYQIARRYGDQRADEIERLIGSFPLDVIEADLDLTREAARLKAAKRLAYADCFAAALAKIRNAELYTGDPEFKAVEKEIKIIWL